MFAVILITIVDMIAFFPTFRKSYHKPQEETLSEYGLAALKFFISLFALSSFNVSTILYPISLVVTNGAFVAFAWVRRKNVGRRDIRKF